MVSPIGIGTVLWQVRGLCEIDKEIKDSDLSGWIVCLFEWYIPQKNPPDSGFSTTLITD
jgi:hypothetical protein